MIQAVILAGGKGTRLAAVSDDLPKPLVPVGGVPIIERHISLLAHEGVEEIFVTTGHRADAIEERLGDGSRLGVYLHHVREETPLGTAGGVAALRGRLHDDFFVLYGDVLVHMDLKRLLDFHRSARAEATLVVHPNDHPYDSDLLELDAHGRVRALHPKPRPSDGPDLPNLVSAALYVLSTSALDFIEPGVKQDFVVDVFPRMLQNGAAIFGYRTPEYLKDMGTPERLATVEQDLDAGVVEARHWNNDRPTAFLDRDGVINAETGGVHRPEQLELLPGVAEAIGRLNQSGWLTAVVTNQPDVAKGFMSEADLERIHHRLETRLGAAHAWIDALAYCPHHPDRGFEGERPELKIACACRKPGHAMLESVTRSLPVNVSQSALVGDSWRDVVAARAFGIDAVGVWTGHGMTHAPPPEHALAARPDVMVEDLGQAVSLLLDRDPGVDALEKRVLDRLDAGGPSPLMILVGGLSRVGKSGTVFRLRRQLRWRGVDTLWTRLDDWLVPASERGPNSTLAERYRLPDLQRALGLLARGSVVTAPGYDARSREALPSPVTYDAREVDVVIVEGVPALLLEPEGMQALRVHLAAPSPQERLRRLQCFYRFKHLSAPEIDRLLADRSEECSAVEASAYGTEIRFVPRLAPPTQSKRVES